MHHGVSAFPLNERILELAWLLVVPGAIPAKAGPDAVHFAAAVVEECEFLLTWNFRHMANLRILPGSGEDSFEPWLHQNDHPYAGRAYPCRNRGRMTCSKGFMRRETRT